MDIFLTILFIVFISLGVILPILMCFQESKRRKISFLSAILLCIFLSPVFGYFIIISRPLRNSEVFEEAEKTEVKSEM